MLNILNQEAVPLDAQLPFDWFTVVDSPALEFLVSPRIAVGNFSYAKLLESPSGP
jgi:hypothetical protein